MFVFLDQIFLSASVIFIFLENFLDYYNGFLIHFCFDTPTKTWWCTGPCKSPLPLLLKGWRPQPALVKIVLWRHRWGIPHLGYAGQPNQTMIFKKNNFKICIKCIYKVQGCHGPEFTEILLKFDSVSWKNMKLSWNCLDFFSIRKLHAL